MAGRKRQGSLQADMVFSTLEESDASQAVKNASKHVVDGKKDPDRRANKYLLNRYLQTSLLKPIHGTRDQ
eukprot:914617-Prorocentrum_lima.AAC.1